MTDKKSALAFYCSTSALGGLELNLVRLAGWLQERGWKCTVVAPHHAPILQEATGRGIPVREIKQTAKYFDIGGALSLGRVLAELQADILLIRAPRDINLGALTKTLFKFPENIVYMQGMQLGIRKRDLIHRWQFNRLDRWVASLEWLGSQAKELAGIREEQLAIIPLSIELHRFLDNSTGREDARRLLGVPDSATIVGNVGRLDRGKRQEDIIRAVALAQKQQPERQFHILLVGEETRDERGGYSEELQRIAAEEELGAALTIAPFRSDIEHAYAAMDMFVMSTPSETFGTVTIEAMASGVSVIAANGGGSPEILGNGTCGLLYEPGNSASLAEEILRLKGSPDLQNRLAEAARQEARQRFSHVAACERFEALFRSL